MDKHTREAVLKRIKELENKALERLAVLEASGALSGDESAGTIMADITAELASGYADLANTKDVRNLRKF